MKPELEDLVLKHHGVRGMHWGRRKGSSDEKYTRKDLKADRKEISNKVRDKELTRKEGLQARRENIHKIDMTQKVYKRMYDKAISKGMSELHARTVAKTALRQRNEARREMGVQLLDKIDSKYRNISLY